VSTRVRVENAGATAETTAATEDPCDDDEQPWLGPGEAPELDVD
jgi:hypothetical protein